MKLLLEWLKAGTMIEEDISVEENVVMEVFSNLAANFGPFFGGMDQNSNDFIKRPKCPPHQCVVSN